MSAATYIAAIEMKPGKILEGSTLRALVSRITAFWQETLNRSADLKQSAAVNAVSNELRRERHVCTALMHQ